MTEVSHWGSLYGPRVQDLAAVTETMKLRSPARRGDLFWELIRCQCSAPGSQSFRRYSFRSTHDAGERRRIEFGACSSCLIVVLGPNNEHLPVVGQRGVVGLHAIFCAIYPIRVINLILGGVGPDRIRRVSA
jgi:hypothetical protein